MLFSPILNFLALPLKPVTMVNKASQQEMGNMFELSTIAKRLQSQLVEWRRIFHENPEPSGCEYETAGRIAEICRSLGLRTVLHEDICAVIAEYGKPSDQQIAFRADIDALRSREESGLPFASNLDCAHLCGHDLHIAMCLGAALLANETKSEIPIRLIFQPHEEVPPGGATHLIAKGTLKGVRSIYGLHVNPLDDTGHVTTRQGAFFAASDNFTMTIHGRSGHAAAPHKASDTIHCAGSIIVSAQAIASRLTDPLDPVVVSIAAISGGTTHNILPDSVVMRGTIRSFSEDTRKQVHDMLCRIGDNITASFGCTAETCIELGYDTLVNSAQCMRYVAGAMEANPEVGTFDQNASPLMFGEDFGYYLKKVPGVFMMIGAGSGMNRYPLHNSRVVFDEDVLWRGSALLYAIALEESREKTFE